MIFNSIQYGLFLTVVFFCFWSLTKPSRSGIRLWLMLGASYFFYANWEARYLLLIVGVTLINYVAALGIESYNQSDQERFKKYWLAAAVAGSLGILVVFKYYNFFMDNFEGLIAAFGFRWTTPASKLLLPVGISFFTFQSMSYTIDVYRGEISATRSIRDFALYVAFFPQLVAGPIIRAKVLIPQLKKIPVGNQDQVMRGLYQVLCGLFKKMVIADALAFHIVDKVFAHPDRATLPMVWLAMYGYALQIYCDFSGYSDVAIGSARMLGIEIPENFRRPYLAKNLRDFWQRWHISLSTWLRDYLYISLGGNRHGKNRMYLALFVTMLLGGLWHGAAWTFVAWGTIHGILLMINRWWQDRRPAPEAPAEENKLTLWAKRFVTFHIVCLLWVIFRSKNIDAAWVFIHQLFGGELIFKNFPPKGFTTLCIGYFLHFSPINWRDWLGRVYVASPAVVQGTVLAIMIALFNMMAGVSNPFIYFQF